MKRILLLLAALTIGTTALAQSSLKTTIRQVQGDAALRGATWGVLAVRLGGDTGRL